MLMKKIYSFFLMLALTCVSTAWAYDVNITSDPEDNYDSGSQSFDVTEILSALDLADGDALTALLENPDNVYLKTTEDRTNTHMDEPSLFWMDKEGVQVGWGDNAAWFAGLFYDTKDEDGNPIDPVFYVQVGQMPNVFKKIYEPTDLACTLYLVNGEKEIEFNVNLHVNAAPQPTEVYLSTLQIVADYELPLNFTIGKSYEGKTYSATLEGVYEALGTTAEEFDSKASAQTYTQTYINLNAGDTSKDAFYELKDSLSHPEDAADGAWFGRYANYDESTGEDIPLEINAPKAWNTGANTFYTQEITLAEGEYSINSGQFPGTFTSTEDNDSTFLYLVNGDKAARIKVKVVMEEPPTIDPDAMVEIGSTNVEVSAVINDSYSTKAFSVDMDAICEALGCTIDDIDDIYAMSGGSISDNHTEGSGGFYFNEEGVITSWGSSSAFFVAIDNLKEGKLKVGQMQGHFTNITEPVTCNAQLVFKYLQNYYSVNLAYTVTVTSDIDPSSWTQAYAAAYDVQLISSEGYGQDPSCKTSLDMTAIATAIGTEDPILYGEKWTDDVMSYSDAYSCDPNPGFWMAEDGKSVGSWGSTSAYGMTYANGVITYYAMPDARTVGQTFESVFYLVNEENGKYAKITLDIEYVKERGEASKPVGESDVTFSLSEDNIFSDGLNEGLYQSNPIDWEPVFEALGITADDLETAEWLVQNSGGKLVTYGATDIFVGEDAMMDENGHYIDNIDDIDKAVFAIAFDLPSQSFSMSLLGNEPEAGVIYTTKVGLKTEAGVYVFNISAGDTETVTRVDAPEATVTIDKFIDMSGREVPVPVKGSIYVNAKRQKVVY